MAEVFNCSWLQGSDPKNTDATTEDVFDSADAEVANEWEDVDDANGWNGETGWLRYDDNGSPLRAAVVAISAASPMGVRLGIYVDNQVGEADRAAIVRLRNNAASETLAYIDVVGHADAGKVYLSGRFYDTGGTLRTIGNIEILIDTYYQVECLWTQNTTDGFKVKAWNEAGDTPVGSEQSDGVNASRNRACDQVSVGYPIEAWVTLDARLDIFVIDGAGYPGPKAAAGGGRTTRNTDPLMNVMPGVGFQVQTPT
jgi:hypothetical protein